VCVEVSFPWVRQVFCVNGQFFFLRFSLLD
jgi:hypothetical protein